MLPRKPIVKKEILIFHEPVEHKLFLSDVEDADIIICVGYHSCTQDLVRCLRSIEKQNVGEFNVAIIIGNDSGMCILDRINDFVDNMRIIVLDIVAGNASRSRNILLDYIDTHIKKEVWVARLDADDEFSDSCVLLKMMSYTNECNIVLGGNLLRCDGKIIGENRATVNLKSSDYLLEVLKRMSNGSSVNEIPSCNLLFKSHCGIRYPYHSSAEDHWLVCSLLIFSNSEINIAEDVIYCAYQLDGATTANNRKNKQYYDSRVKLYSTVKQWVESLSLNTNILGYGNEGIVSIEDKYVIKEFYQLSMDDKTAAWLNSIDKDIDFLPNYSLNKISNRWRCIYTYEKTAPCGKLTVKQISDFLIKCWRAKVIPSNIKRDNLRVAENGALIYIDIGSDIVPFEISRFLDISARLYAIGILNLSESYIFRYKTEQCQNEIFESLNGFDSFYSQLVQRYFSESISCVSPQIEMNNSNVTLLIKCCAMDSDFIEGQILHIVRGLESPQKFNKKIVLIDSFEGPYLRAYAIGNLQKVISVCKCLKERGIIDDILFFPKSNKINSEINRVWFDCDTDESHTLKQVPVASQLWAFEQVTTRYVLQCDLDVLIGRRDYNHDYLCEMLSALSHNSSALSCGFNIPKSPLTPYEEYLGSFVPEVRLGLLDLCRIKQHRPYPNTVCKGKLLKSWYRSIEQYQLSSSMTSLRGGDPKTFYIHPPNTIKKDPDFLQKVRRFCEIGLIPESQILKWDLEYSKEKWIQSVRNESVMFLIKGRNTPLDKIKRCLTSLKAQNRQDFGVIIIDDYSDDEVHRHYASLLDNLHPRSTVIYRNRHFGRMPNIIEGVKHICQNPESLIVILDMDDALIDNNVVSILSKHLQEGYDLIQGGMFRMDKPVKQYKPIYSSNIRNEFGNDTWIHLRAFKKKLFEAIPESYFKIKGKWIEECTDYAVMIPLVEIAQKPIFIDQYMYLHERSTKNPNKIKKAEIINGIMQKKRLLI